MTAGSGSAGSPVWTVVALACLMTAVGCQRRTETAHAPQQAPGQATAKKVASQTVGTTDRAKSQTVGTTDPAKSQAVGTPDEASPAVADAPLGATRVILSDIGLSTPESVLHDTEADVYLVSNIAGSPLGKDDNGFITRLSPAGKVLAGKWIDGAADDVQLNAPKGSAIVGERLYVADIDVVRIFDRRTGKQAPDVAVKGATFLNDICAGERLDIYVTDSGLKAGFKPSGTDAVYRVDRKGRVTVVARTPELGRPNGIVMHGGSMRVVTFGSGEVYRLGQDGARDDVIKSAAGNLDGVVVDANGGLLISSWQASAVLAGGPSGPFEARFTDLEAPADIGLDPRRNRLLVPLFKRDAIALLEL